MRWKAVETKDLGLRLKGTPTDHDSGQDVGLRLARSPVQPTWTGLGFPTASLSRGH